MKDKYLHKKIAPNYNVMIDNSTTVCIIELI